MWMGGSGNNSLSAGKQEVRSFDVGTGRVELNRTSFILLILLGFRPFAMEDYRNHTSPEYVKA